VSVSLCLTDPSNDPLGEVTACTPHGPLHTLIKKYIMSPVDSA